VSLQNVMMMPGSLAGGSLSSWMGPKRTLILTAALTLACQGMLISAYGGVAAVLAVRATLVSENRLSFCQGLFYLPEEQFFIRARYFYALNIALHSQSSPSNAFRDRPLSSH